MYGRLVEVHHVHPPPPTQGAAVAPEESGDGKPPQDSAKSTTAAELPVQDGSELQSKAGSDVSTLDDSQRSDPTESLSPKDVDNQLRETDAGQQQTVPKSEKVERISHISVGPGSPALNPGEQPIKGRFVLICFISFRFQDFLS